MPAAEEEVEDEADEVEGDEEAVELEMWRAGGAEEPGEEEALTGPLLLLLLIDGLPEVAKEVVRADCWW